MEKTENEVVAVKGRVCVRKLAYETRESELREFCEKAGKVKDVQLIKRSHIPACFGFVDFEDEKDADKACIELKGAELNGKNVEVELARPRSGDRRPPRAETSRAETETFSQRDGRRARGGRRYRSRNDPRPGTPSPDTLFVSNIPYSATEDDLETFFKEYNVKDVRILKTQEGNSRGIGYVTLGSEQEQLLAMKEMINARMDDRVLWVKISIDYTDEKKSE
ncbi:MAG: single-stranded telomeric binding protein Tgc1 [Amphiamblys sp. WSBS2006]|nr:MAG: single-stranded telomeric binding protein Tgc1 [Amphiamblys sp. WSBS2006]